MDKSSEKESPDKSTGAEQEKRDPSSLKRNFEYFSRFGDTQSDGQTITLRNIDKWFQQANLLGGSNKITTADTAITFSKVAARGNRRINFTEFQEFIVELVKGKEIESETVIEKLIAAGGPELSNVTTPVTSGAVGANLERMTDTSLYTGSHKERFDEEGQGRGKEGREDVAEDSGYVQGYKEKDTYDEKTKKA